MKLHEYQSKQLFAQAGIPIPRGRVAATVLTLAVGVAMIVSVTGYMTYWFEELFFRNAETGLQENSGFGFFPIDINQGLQAYTGSPAGKCA